MTKLALATVMATLVSHAAGCVIDTTDRPPGGGGGGVDVATISARWSLRNMIDGSTSRCPSGFDTVQLLAQAIDSNGDPVDEPAADLFDCNARSGVMTDLPPDVYQVWIEVLSRDRTQLYAQSLSQLLDLRQVDQTFETDVLNDGGYFQLSWDLVGKTTNRPLGCSQVVGLDKIKTISTSVASAAFAYDDSFVCEDHAAVSRGLLEGTYTISIDAVAGSTPVGQAPALTTTLIAGQNQVTDLGTIVIPISGL
jgi:hypothetical protein